MDCWSFLYIAVLLSISLVSGQKRITFSSSVKATTLTPVSVSEDLFANLDVCSQPCVSSDVHSCKICSEVTFSCPRPSRKLSVLCKNYVSELTANMTVINVQGNALTDFSSFPQTLAKLDELNILGNSLTSISKADLARFPALEKLDISDNRLDKEALPEDVFESVPLLEVLNIRALRLRTLEANVFKNNRKLSILAMEGNQMETVPREALQKVSYSLETLYLSGNPIKRIEAADFDYLVKLRHLKIDNTNIYQIKAFTFASLSELTEISLEHNAHLEFIDEDAFGFFSKRPGKMASKLERVSFRACALRSLDQHTVNLLGVKELGLSSNPWQCDCTIRWMVDKQLLEKATGREEITKELQKTKCMDAPHREMFVGSLPKDRFVCLDDLQARDTPLNRVAGGLGGTAVLIVTVMLCVSAIVFSAILLRKITLKNEQTRVQPAAAHQYRAIYNQGHIHSHEEGRSTRQTALLKDPFEL